MCVNLRLADFCTRSRQLVRGRETVSKAQKQRERGKIAEQRDSLRDVEGWWGTERAGEPISHKS